MGFESERVLIATSICAGPATAPEARLAMFERMRDAVAGVPGIDAAAAIVRDTGQRQHVESPHRVPGYDGRERDRSRSSTA